jgi:hypothetical protein
MTPLLKKFSTYYILIAIVTGCVQRETITTETITVDLTDKWDETRVLKNPHKGWYHHLLDNGVAKYSIENDSIFTSFPGMDHLYLRLAWSYLEPREGEFDWHRIDEVVEKYVPLGYGISFRITCKETGTYPGVVGQQRNGVQYATPLWVEEAGAKGTTTEAWGVSSWTPVWDDPVYLAKLDNFHRAFAARYDHEQWVRYIDIGSIGEWGEGHTSFSTQIPPTVDEVIAHVDLHLKHYTRSLLVATDDLLYYGKPTTQADTLFEYVTSRGITLRDDSPLVDWYLEQNLDSWSVSHPRFFDPLYLEKPIIFELQHYHIVKDDGNWLGKNGEEVIPKYGFSGAHILRKAIETMGATWIGYHGYAEEWLADNPDLTRELANRCGYWYFPMAITLPDIMKSGSEQPVGIHWVNKGVAPAYVPFSLELQLSSLDGSEVYAFQQDAGNLKWMPGDTIASSYLLELPSEMKAGHYNLQIRLYDKADKVPVNVGLSATTMDNDGFYQLTEVLVK